MQITTMKQNTLMKHTLLAATLAALVLPAAAQETAASAKTPPVPTVPVRDDWSFTIAPYIWVPQFAVEASVPQGSVGSSASKTVSKSGTVQDFETDITGGFMLAAQARYRSFGLLVDVNWLRLDTESHDPGTLYSDVNLTSDIIYSTAALTYELPLKGKFHAEVQGGVRLWSVYSDFELTSSSALPSEEKSRGEVWVTPLFGAALRYDLPLNLALLVQGTAGGFSGDSMQYDVYGGVGYRFNHWCMISLGYRYLHETYEKGNFTFNGEAKGLQFGAAFSF